MKPKLMLLISLLFATSTSWGQTLIWTKTIKSPIDSAIPKQIHPIAKSSAYSAVIIDWSTSTYDDVAPDAQQLLWFGTKGSILHSEILDDIYVNYNNYGISTNRLVLIQTDYNPEGSGYSTSYLIYTRSSSGRVTKTIIDSGTYVDSDTSINDAVGFYAIEKGPNETWIIKRYIY